MSRREGPTYDPVYDPAASAVRVRGLRRRLAADAGVLDGIDLDIRPGELVAVVGRRGSGRRTLLRALAGEGSVAGSGHVRVPDTVEHLGATPRLLTWKRVLDSVASGLVGHDTGLRARRALAAVGLAERADDFPGDLSPVDRHRADLARVFARRPELLLADAPFAPLDPASRIAVGRQLRALVDEHAPTVVLVTDDIHEAITLADRVVLLDDGAVHLDVPVFLRGRRPQAEPECAALRDYLLAEIARPSTRDEAAGARVTARGPATARRDTA